MKELIIKTQKELDTIPKDFNGTVYIEGGSQYDRLEIKVKFDEAKIIVRGDVWVEAWGSSHVEAWGSSHVVAWGSSHVVAWGSSYVVARESSHVVAWGSSYVVARESSYVVAWESSYVVARESSYVVARESSYVEAWGSSHVEAWGSSQTQLYGEAMVSAFSAKEIICKGYNVISVSESNRKGMNIVMNKDSYLKITPDFEPTFKEFSKRYPVEIKGKTVILYKAVHKKDGKYFSDYRSDFEYKIGEKMEHECDQGIENSCSTGLHISCKSWAKSFGASWTDMALLECKVPVNKIVVSKDCDGKVRTSELTVVREINE